MPPVTCWKSAGVMVYKGELEVWRLLPLAGPWVHLLQTRVSVYIECRVQCFTHSSGVSFHFFFP